MSVLKIRNALGEWEEVLMLKGDKGDKGIQGDKGDSISSVVFNSDYTLTITFTDGTSYTTPSIRGEKGMKGDVGNGIASTVLNDDYTLTINFTDGTQYTTSPIRGKQGEKGNQGETGESGVYVGTEPPTDEDIDVWIDSDGTADDVITDVQVNGVSVVTNGVANISVPLRIKDDPSNNGGVIEGYFQTNHATGNYSHASGTGTTASGNNSNAEGGGTIASGSESHAEGGGTTASAQNSHSEGAGTYATAPQAHAEGSGTRANGVNSHTEGQNTLTGGVNAHAEGTDTQANGLSSHAEGTGTIAQRKSQLVIGECNIPDTSGSNNTTKGDYIFIAGNGTNTNNGRSNAMTLDWNGNEKLAGSLTLGMNTQNEVTITAQELKALKDDYSSALMALGVI